MTSIIMMKRIVMPTMTIDLSKAASEPLNPTNIHECLQLPVPPHITLTYIYTIDNTIHNTQYTIYVLQIQKYNCAIVSQQIIPSSVLPSTQTLENTMLESILEWWRARSKISFTLQDHREALQLLVKSFKKWKINISISFNSFICISL